MGAIKLQISRHVANSQESLSSLEGGSRQIKENIDAPAARNNSFESPSVSPQRSILTGFALLSLSIACCLSSLLTPEGVAVVENSGELRTITEEPTYELLGAQRRNALK